MFSVFITHHLKIRELSDKNINWKQYQTNFSTVRLTYFELWVMEIELWGIETQKSNSPKLLYQMEPITYTPSQPSFLSAPFGLRLNHFFWPDLTLPSKLPSSTGLSAFESSPAILVPLPLLKPLPLPLLLTSRKLNYIQSTFVFWI